MDPFAPEDTKWKFPRFSSSVAAALSSAVFWGAGQILNGEMKKGFVFFSAQLVSLLYIWDYFSHYLVYQVLVFHLGHLFYSLCIFFFSLFSLFLWAYNIFDAHRIASFLEFVSWRNPEGADEIEGWDFEVRGKSGKKSFPWGAGLLYVLCVLAILRYILGGGVSELEKAYVAVQKNPQDLELRIRLAQLYVQNGKERHALLEIDEYLASYASTLSVQELQKIRKYSQSLKDYVRTQGGFIVEKVIEGENRPDWTAMVQSQDFEKLQKEGMSWLEIHKDDPILVRILLSRFMELEDWEKARKVVSLAMRIRPHDPELIRTLGVIEKNLSLINQTEQKENELLNTYQKAVELYKSSDYTKASQYLDRWFELGGRQKDGFLLQQSCLNRLEQEDKLRELFKKALEIWPEDLDFLKGYGRTLFKMADYEKALEVFEKVASLEETWQVFKSLGVINRKLEKFSQAALWYKKALVLKKDDPDLLFLLGYSLLMQKDRSSLEIFNQLSVLDAQYPQLSWFLALSQELNGLLIGALKTLEKMESSSPWYQESRTKIKELRARIEKIEEAKKGKSASLLPPEKQQEDLPKSDPSEQKIDEIAVKMENAEKAFLAGEWLSAKNLYNQVLDENPEHWYARRQIARILLEREGDYVGSFEHLQIVLKARPDDIWSMVAMGIVAKAQGRVSESVFWFEKAILLEPGNLNANFNLALLYEDQNQIEKAKSYYKAVILNHPQYQLAYNYLGDIYYNEGDFVRASEMYRQVVEISPANLGIRFKLALCLEKGADPSLALKELDFISSQAGGDVFLEDEIRVVRERILKRIKK